MIYSHIYLNKNLNFEYLYSIHTIYIMIYDQLFPFIIMYKYKYQTTYIINNHEHLKFSIEKRNFFLNTKIYFVISVYCYMNHIIL